MIIKTMEFEIVKFFSQLGAPWIDPATIFISSNTLIGTVGIIITAYFFIYDKKNGRQLAVASGIAMVLHFAISEIFFKHILPEFGLFRLRPYLAHPGEIIGLGKLNTDSSFPSSHMAYTLSLLTVWVYYGAVGEKKVLAEPKLIVKSPPRHFVILLRNWAYYYRKYLWPAVAFAIFMAFARIHNGMHYPGDVLAGAALGILYGCVAIKFVKKIIKV